MHLQMTVTVPPSYVLCNGGAEGTTWHFYGPFPIVPLPGAFKYYAVQEAM